MLTVKGLGEKSQNETQDFFHCLLPESGGGALSGLARGQQRSWLEISDSVLEGITGYKEW